MHQKIEKGALKDSLPPTWSICKTRALPLSRGSSQWGGVNVTGDPSKLERMTSTEYDFTEFGPYKHLR